MNMAESVESYNAGLHDGYEVTAYEGIRQTLDVIAQKGIKVVVNGGALNPSGLAKKLSEDV